MVTNHGVTADLISDANKNPSITSATIATTTRPAVNSNMFIVPAIYSMSLYFQVRWFLTEKWLELITRNKKDKESNAKN